VITLEELQLKFKSEIASATSKDEAALARVDAAVRQSALGLAKLQQSHSAAAAAARKAEFGGNIAESQKARALEATSASALAKGFGQHNALAAAKPELIALARRKNAVLEQATAAKRAAAEQATAAKQLAKARNDASEAAHAKQIDESRMAMVGAAGAAAGFALALGAATIATLAFGFGAAGAARDARILGEALTGSAALGSEFNAVVNQLAAKVPLAKEKIGALAQEMSLLKLGRRDLQAGLTSVAVVTSALGDSAGNAIKSIVEASAVSRRFSLGMRDRFGELTALAGTGLRKADVLGALATRLGKSLPDVEKQLLQGRVTMKDGLAALEAAAKGRFGKTLSAQMLSLDTQFAKAKEGFGAMFADADIEPGLKGLKELLSIFDQGTVQGVVMKTALTTGLNGVSSALGVILPLGKSFFLEATIGALELYLALRPIGRKISEWAAPFLTAENAATAGKIAIYGVAAAFALAAIAAGTAAVAIVGPFLLIAAAVYAAVLGVQAAWDWLTGSARAAASSLIDGFVGWIESGASRVVGAMTGLASKAAGAFKSALGIASPSKVFAAYGRYTVQGLTEGIEQEAPQAHAAVEALGGAAPAAPALGGGSSGAGTTINIENVYFGGKKATEQEKSDLVSFLIDMIDGAVGAGAAGLPAGLTA
jgi:hypothetical protein